MRIFVSALISFILVSIPPSLAIADDYWINVQPSIVRGFTVELDIETNVPGECTLAARLVYLDRKPDDPAVIGTGYIRFPVTNGKGKVTINGKEAVVPRGFKLPNGNYEAEVVYNHLWPVNTEATKRIKVSYNFRGKASMSLTSTESPKSEKDSGDNAQWVMENVFNGYVWDQRFWERKFGELEPVDYLGTGDVTILKMYYVKSINMTLLVNETRGVILAYRLGLAHE